MLMSTLPCSEENLPAWQKANQPLRLGAMVKGKYARRAYSLQLRPFHCDIVCKKCAPAGEEVDVAAIMGKSRRRLIYLPAK